MESRFSKYKSESKATSDQIANINNFIDYLYSKGLDMVENEIHSLNELMKRGENNAMFPKKVDQLIALGEDIERLYESYHFNKSN